MALDQEKQIAEIKNLRADYLKKIVTLCAGVSSTLGLVIVFIYCFFIINFFPSGLSVGDTLFFVFVMLAFSCVGALSVMMGFFPFIPWATQKTKSNGKLKDIGNIFSIALVTFVLGVIFFLALTMPSFLSDSNSFQIFIFSTLIFIAIYLSVALELTEDRSLSFMCIFPLIISACALGFVAALINSREGNGFLVSFAIPSILLISGMFLSLGISTFSTFVLPVHPGPPVPPVPPSPVTANLDARAQGAYAFILMGILFAYIPFLYGQESVNYVMHGLGLRSDAILIVSKTNFLTMQAAANAKGVRLNSCKVDDESYSISNVRVLWHGIGLRSYIELKGEYKKEEAKQGADKPEKGSKNKAEENNIKIELDSTGVRVLKGGEEKVCGELRSGIYFDSGEDTLGENQLKISRSFIDEFMRTEKSNRVKKIIIIGFADPMPREKDGNFVLAHKRACTIYHQMVKDELIEKTEALIDVRLDRDNISGCGEIKEAVKQSACFEQGRRVELQIVEGAGAVARAGTADALAACGSTAKKK